MRLNEFNKKLEDMTDEELFEELHRLEQSMDETMTTIEQKIKQYGSDREGN